MEISKSTRITLLVFFFIGIFVELAMQSFWLGKFGPYISPIVWFLGGLTTCVAAFFLIAFKKSPSSISLDYYQRYNNALMILSVTLFSALTIAAFLSGIFHKYPSDPAYSDILPSLEAYVRRFLSGANVYDPIVFSTWTVLPTYFPLMWMPYCFSELLHIDYRWTAYLVFVIAIYLCNLKMVRYDTPYAEAGIKAMMPFLFILAILQYQEHEFGYAVELLPIGFYLILTLSIFNRSRMLMSLGILLCLLSRYAFTLWLPVYFLVIWMEWGFKEMFRVGIVAFIGVLFLYVFPFLSKDWTILTDGLAYYDKTALDQWFTQSWQAADAKPHHLNRGMGFAIYFYDFVGGEVVDRLALNKIVHRLVALVVAILIFSGYFFWRKKGLNVKVYLIIALKFYLLFFYGLFQVPFGYLFMLPLFMSFPLIYMIPIRKGRFWALKEG